MAVYLWHLLSSIQTALLCTWKISYSLTSSLSYCLRSSSRLNIRIVTNDDRIVILPKFYFCGIHPTTRRADYSTKRKSFLAQMPPKARTASSQSLQCTSHSAESMAQTPATVIGTVILCRTDGVLYVNFTVTVTFAHTNKPFGIVQAYVRFSVRFASQKMPMGRICGPWVASGVSARLMLTKSFYPYKTISSGSSVQCVQGLLGHLRD